ncbi:threonine--tRNA ligase [Spiribacter sp. C176]|uniref:Threonine--tRNA ligase n=1 Tax=Spiribacter salilacus TaxID=2664894 RepID=A0A6N7QMY9_9GAMM|nr:threonine--tRNA ligase [Spiribacter salilacus]MRH77402.1 threonine--tRNA ligase [Spiribacter salilacus]
MPQITLPDGSQRGYAESVSVLDVARDIGPGLAKATVAGRVNGKLVDACDLITDDAELQIITPKDADGVDIIRHSCAHLLGHAVKQLYPEAQMAIGPVIEDGFYYDIRYDAGFHPEDLERIEQRMLELIDQDYDVVKRITPRYEVLQLFRERGEDYKVQLVEDMPEVEAMALYYHQEYIDMCIGPHVPNTRFLKAVKLTKLAGAYWRGDPNNEMLQRIYGTAFADRKGLKAYLALIEEAQKRDHRRIARNQDLFHLQDEAPGMVFWHPNGWRIYTVLQDYLRGRLEEHGYQEIRTPELVDRSLWERSGHWEKFREDMFTTQSENRDYAVKPMNCPCHVQVYNQGLKSYRDLPIRFSEFGNCHRNEPSGTLHGLMRVRNFVQDDAHIFCSEEALQAEVSDFLDLAFSVYSDFGFDNVAVALSTRPKERVGEDSLWDKAEAALEQALDGKGMEWTVNPGEGAFYGPKIELSMRDCLNRVWQCGTMQVDFSMPGRLGAEYVTETGDRAVPVMLHRAIFGSFERFIGVLTEHYGGNWPVWLAPTQVEVLNITDRQADYAQEIQAKLVAQGLRAQVDLRNEKVGFKIREHTMKRIPYLVVVGDQEREAQTVAVRTRTGEDLGAMSLEKLVDKLKADIALLGRQH